MTDRQDIEKLLFSLDLLAPKNPKNEWSKEARKIVNEAKEVLIEYLKILIERDME